MEEGVGADKRDSLGCMRRGGGEGEGERCPFPGAAHKGGMKAERSSRHLWNGQAGQGEGGRALEVGVGVGDRNPCQKKEEKKRHPGRLQSVFRACVSVCAASAIFIMTVARAFVSLFFCGAHWL